MLGDPQADEGRRGMVSSDFPGEVMICADCHLDRLVPVVAMRRIGLLLRIALGGSAFQDESLKRPKALNLRFSVCVYAASSGFCRRHTRYARVCWSDDIDIDINPRTYTELIACLARWPRRSTVWNRRVTIFSFCVRMIRCAQKKNVAEADESDWRCRKRDGRH